MRDTQRGRGGLRHRQREKQAPCREPDVGLDPRAPGSGPGPKAALNRWATRAALYWVILDACVIWSNKHYVSPNSQTEKIGTGKQILAADIILLWKQPLASTVCPDGLQCDMAGNGWYKWHRIRATKLHVFLRVPDWLRRWSMRLLISGLWVWAPRSM